MVEDLLKEWVTDTSLGAGNCEIVEHIGHAEFGQPVDQLRRLLDRSNVNFDAPTEVAHPVSGAFSVVDNFAANRFLTR